MPLVEPLAPEGHRRMPWKNGRGELVVIDCEGGKSWQDMGVAWHFGRTAIIEEGPFSDYAGYERLQVVTKGAGLVLIAPDHEIDLRLPMHPQALRRRHADPHPARERPRGGREPDCRPRAFDIELREGKAGAEMFWDLAGTSCMRRRRGARRNRRTRLHPHGGSRTARAHRFRDRCHSAGRPSRHWLDPQQGLDQSFEPQ